MIRGAEQDFGSDVVVFHAGTARKHDGALAFTIGQRKGLNVGFPTDDGKPRFVLEIRPKDNTVVVGPREALDLAELAGSKISWAGLPPVEPETPFDCEVQIRAHADPVPAVAFVRPSTGSGPELVIRPVNPLNGVSPGQSAVIYVGTRVLGQCTIDRTVSAVPAATSA